jgi:hypothetical protein
LTNALRKQPETDLATLKNAAAGKLVSNLLSYDSPHEAKASVQLLSNMLQKGVLGRTDLLASLNLSPNHGRHSSKTAGEETFLLVLFRWLGRGDFASTISTAVSLFLHECDRDGVTASIGTGCDLECALWVEPLQDAYDENAVSADDLRAHVLPVLFKINPGDLLSFLQAQGLSAPPGLSPREKNFSAPSITHRPALLHAALQTGKELGLIEEADCEAVSYKTNKILLPLRFVKTMTLQGSRDARITGFLFMINSPATTKPLCRSAIDIIKEGLEVFFADVDAEFRSDVFSAFQKLVDRMRSITGTLAKQAKQASEQPSLTAVEPEQKPLPGQSSPPATPPQAILKYHLDFLQWLPRFLTEQFRSTASYQRHISSLKCFSILTRSALDKSVAISYLSKSAVGEAKWPIDISLLNPDIQRCLVDLLFDPFEDVRRTASSILESYTSTVGDKKADLSTSYLKALERGEDLMFLTGRADHADGVAHLYALLYQSRVAEAQCHDETSDPEGMVLKRLLVQLGDLVKTAQTSLGQAVEKFPLHGVLTSIRKVLEVRSHYENDSVPGEICSRLWEIWDIVKPILCNDAPEGYLPDELEGSRESAKEMLSYCWRALKESSLLLSTVISMRSWTDNAGATLIDRTTELCFTQLAELRHRGAFSTVAQTWTTICTRSNAFPGLAVGGKSRLELWYSDAVDMLHRNVTINTRRSAGLPALICGVLIGDRTGGLLARAFEDLEAVARQDVDATAAEEGSLSQVHAMNCLKDILKNAKLGERSEPHVPSALQLAADALRSEVWAIRNCGLMLFRAVIDRLLGTSEAHFDEHDHTQKRISLETNPHLLDVVLKLLDQPQEATSGIFEGVFPALQLLQHMVIPKIRISEAVVAVQKLTTSPSWHVRDKAARTYASLVSLNDLVSGLDMLLLKETTHENEVHGTLLSTKYVLQYAKRSSHHTESRSDVSSPTDESYPLYFRLAEASGKLLRSAKSPVAKAACIDVVRECSAVLASFEQGTIEDDLHELLIETFFHGMQDPRPDSAVKFADLIEQHSLDSAAAVFYQAWSRLVAQYLTTRSEMSKDKKALYRGILSDLVTRDQDAISCFLKTVPSQALRTEVPVSDVVVQLSTHILNIPTGTGLKCDALGALILADSGRSSTELTEVASASEHLTGVDCNQRYADQCLELQTLFICRDVANVRDMTPELVERITRWATDCATAIDDTGIYTRDAAAEALERANSIWPTMSQHSELDAQFFRLCIGVYDLLNDDDEDTRLLAATITGRVLTAAKPGVTATFEPLVASRKLIEFCLARWSANSQLSGLAFERAFGIAEGSLPEPAVKQLTAARDQGDFALFAEEKQNLYLDEALEVRTWSRVIQQLSPNAISKHLLHTLARWVEEGLVALAEQSNDSHDGALGWCTNADVFTLGLRIFYGAEVLLKLSAKGLRIPVRPSELTTKLVTCMSAFDPKKADVHCMWRWELERVLTGAIVEKQERMRVVVDDVYERH